MELRASDMFLEALVLASLVVGSLSGLGLILAVVGFARERGRWQRWGIWLPAAFGASIAVGVISFALLLASGFD
jgi:hypothetical protein